MNIPKVPQVDGKVPGSPKLQNMEVMKTTGVVIPQEVTTPIRVEVTTTQPPKMKATDNNRIWVSTTPPTRLEEEEIPQENRDDAEQVAVVEEADNRDHNEEEQNQEVENEEVGDQQEDSVETEQKEQEQEDDVEEKLLELESEEQEWKSSREEVENSKEGGGLQKYRNDKVEDNSVESEEIEERESESELSNKDYNNEIGDEQQEDENNEATGDGSDEKMLQNETESNDKKDEKDEEDKLRTQGIAGPVIRFLFRSPNRFPRPRPLNRRMNRPVRPSPTRRPDDRKYYDPYDMSSENRRDYFGRYNPVFNRPTFYRQRNNRYWRGRDNRTPKRGITFTQVFVNKPPHPPVVHRHPLTPVPLRPYPVSPYHGPVIYRVPGVGYSRSFSIQGRQTPGSPPQFTGTYQSTRWPANGPKTQVQVNFSPRIGEPNMACIQPPAVYRCLFGIPSTTPFWYYDARVGKCAVFYFAGCGATLNRFNTRMECETTCMGKYKKSTYFFHYP